MAVKTYAQQLEEVQVAIEKALQAQAYSVAGRTKQMPNLDVLFAQERYLRKMVERENSGNVINVQYVMRE